MSTVRCLRARCKKCGVEFSLKTGNLNKEEVVEKMKNINGFECPGFHIELGTMDNYVAILGEEIVEKEVMTDREWVLKLQTGDVKVLDGGCNTVPELNLETIHTRKIKCFAYGQPVSDEPGVEFRRADSPNGTRFYIEIKEGIN